MKQVKLILVRLREDRGASLIIVLAISIFMSVILGAMVYASTGNLAFAKQLGTPDAASIDIDNAMQTAINQIRNTTYNDNATQNCQPLTMIGGNSGGGLAVTCESVAGTGTFGKVASTSANKPPGAILALGDNESQGIDLAAGSALTVFGEATDPIGKVASNSPIQVGAGASLTASGGATIAAPDGNCAGAGVYSPALPCGSGTVADPAVAAPSSYAQPTAADYSAIYQSVPTSTTGDTATCPGGAGLTVVTFLPGYYDDAAALTKLMSDCPNKVYWFSAATSGGSNYFFDFHNGETPVPNATFGTSPIWTINNASTKVVAGGTADPGTAVAIPGSCTSPVAASGNGGVDFVFGGRSQLVVTAGQMELCGQYSTGAPPTSIYGAKTGSDTTTSSLDMFSTAWSSTVGTTPCSSTFLVAFANPANASYLDTTPAVATTASMTNAGTGTACIRTPTGLGPNSPTTIPFGSVLSNATLIVNHREQTTLTATLAARITPVAIPGATTAPCNADGAVIGPVTVLPNSNNTTLRTDTLDVANLLFSRVHQCGFAGAAVEYYVTRTGGTGPNRVAVLDTIQLNMTFKAAAVRAQNQAITTFTSSGLYSPTPAAAKNENALPGGTTPVTINLPQASGTGPTTTTNCVGGATDYPANSSACAFIKTSGIDTKFYSQGTIYAPRAALDIAQSGFTQPLFPYGLVGRKFALNLTSPSTSDNFNGTSVALPPDSAGNLPVDLNFKAYTCASAWISLVCPDTGQGTGDATSRGSAQVSYADAATVPVSGSRAVNVQSYAIASQQLPTVAQVQSTAVTADSATLQAEVSANGTPITAVQCRYATTPGGVPSATPVGALIVLPTLATDWGVLATCGITPLIPETQYYYTVSATNGAGTTTSDVSTFTTATVLPWVTAGTATAVTPFTATLPGTVSANGFSTAVTCDVSTNAAMTAPIVGSPFTATGSPVGGQGAPVSCDMTGLAQGTPHYYTLSGTSSQGTSTTVVWTFTTSTVSAPAVTSLAATSVTTTTATLPGTVSANGAAITVVECQVATDLGMTAPIGGSPFTATVTGGLPTTTTAFEVPASCGLTGLTPGLQYFFTLSATNSQGTTTSTPVLDFTALLAPGITGANITGTVQVGSQLTANASGVTGVPTPTETYQWSWSATPGGTYTDIGGATDVNYTPVAGDAGRYLKVLITETNGVGSPASFLSGPTTVVNIAPTIAGANISGTVQVGSVLTASASGVTGIPTPTPTYQWQSASAPGGPYTNVASGTSVTYTVVAGDYNMYLQVVITEGNGVLPDASATSAATVAVVGVAPGITGANITGTVAVGSLLTANATGVTGAPTPTPSYQWRRATTAGGTYTDIAGATSQTYTPVLRDGTRFLKVVITETNIYPPAASATSVATVAVVATAPTFTAATFSGTPAVGSTLTAGTTPALPGGVPTPTASYQWQSAGTSGGVYTDIVGATSVDYTLVSTDVARFLKVLVTEDNGVATPITRLSTATTVVTGTAPTITDATITGTVEVGSVLTANSSGVTGVPTPTQAYSWRRHSTTGVCTGGDYNTAVGTGVTYTPVVADMDRCLEVIIIETNTAGSASATSAPTVAVAGTVPTISGASITGAATAKQGVALTAVPGTIGGTPTPTTTYSWRRHSTTGPTCTGGNYTTPVGTGLTFAPGASANNRCLLVIITVTSAAGTASATSATTVNVAAGTNTPAVIGSAEVTGTVRVGSALTANSIGEGGWGTGAPATESYAWQIATDSGGPYSPIGATGLTYTPVAGDYGKFINVIITETVASPLSSASATSAETVAVAGTVPTLASAGKSGTTTIGSTLTAVPGAVTGTPTPTESYQWQRAKPTGAPYTDIVGAIGSTYIIVDADASMFLRVIITETNVVGAVSSTSTSTSAVTATAATFATASISDLTPTVGSELTAINTPITPVAPTAVLSYQWQSATTVGGTYIDIVGATSSAYTPVPDDVGTFVKVLITVDNGVGTPITRLSAATGAVA